MPFTEGVGKSSLISTFVSHHFSEIVPGIMTRVRLPPDPDSNCITTIVDSQGGDAALISAAAAMSLTTGESSSNSLSSYLERASASESGAPRSASVATGIEHVDSIVLVYDLDRVETFYRLENHWLPLIERCYNGEVSSIPVVHE
jgi:Ras family protein T1